MAKAGRKKGSVPWNKGKKETRIEVLQRLSESHKGIVAGMLGKHFTKDSIEKMRKAHLGRKQSDESREKRRRTMKERFPKGTLSEEAKKRISLKLMGHKISEETKAKISSTKKAKHYSHTEEWKLSLSERMKGNKHALGSHGWTRGLTKKTDSRLENMFGWKESKEKVERHKEKIRIARKKQVLPKTDTQPEKTVQQILRQMNIPFQTHVPFLLGDDNQFHQVDIKLTHVPIVIEVDGCYWHQCSECGFNTGCKGETAEQIRMQDNKRDLALRAKGFCVYRVWEHETYDLEKLTEKLENILERVENER